MLTALATAKTVSELHKKIKGYMLLFDSWPQVWGKGTFETKDGELVFALSRPILIDLPLHSRSRWVLAHIDNSILDVRPKDDGVFEITRTFTGK